MFYIFLNGNNSRTIQDIVFKFSAFLRLVKATKCVKFQSVRYTGCKVGIFPISPVEPGQSGGKQGGIFQMAVVKTH